MSTIGDAVAAAIANPRSVLRSVAALVGTVAATVIASGAVNPVPRWLSLVVAVATGIGVYVGAGDGQRLVTKESV